MLACVRYDTCAELRQGYNKTREFLSNVRIVGKYGSRDSMEETSLKVLTTRPLSLQAQVESNNLVNPFLFSNMISNCQTVGWSEMHRGQSEGR